MLVDGVEKKQPKALPHERPDYTKAEAVALCALADGTATSHQQKLALDFIIRDAAGTYDMSYRPRDTHATAFAEGRRSVGHTLVWLMQAAPLEKDNDKMSARRMQE